MGVRLHIVILIQPQSLGDDLYMNPQELQALKVVLERIHDNSVYAFNRAKALEIALVNKHPQLWNEYRDALQQVQQQDVHRDFGSLLDKIG